MATVLDASALLTFLLDEPGKDAVESVLEEAIMSSVNWCEVLQRLIRQDADTAGLLSELEAIGFSVAVFDAQQAERAAALLKQGKAYGLSLGDRACIALGVSKGSDILTADKIWAEAFPALPIQLIRYFFWVGAFINLISKSC